MNTKLTNLETSGINWSHLNPFKFAECPECDHLGRVSTDIELLSQDGDPETGRGQRLSLYKCFTCDTEFVVEKTELEDEPVEDCGYCNCRSCR